MIVRKEENILSYFEIGSFLFCFELDNKLWDFWQLCIYRFSHVIEWRCPKNDSASSENACKCKKPQKQAIQNHCNKFPVLNYLLSVPKVELKQKNRDNVGEKSKRKREKHIFSTVGNPSYQNYKKLLNLSKYFDGFITNLKAY